MRNRVFRWALLLSLIAGQVLQGAQPAADAMLVAALDLEKLSAQDRYYTRYIWLTGRDPVQRWQQFVAISGELNALSLSSQIEAPKLILADGQMRDFRLIAPEEWGDVVMLRADLRAYNQTPEQWEKLRDPQIEQYFHVWTWVTDSKEKGGGYWVIGAAPNLIEPLGAKVENWLAYRTAAKYLLKQTESTAPIIEGRNFIWQVSINFNRPAGYYSWLRINSRADFEKLVRILKPVVRREAVEVSGVAIQARAIDRFGRGDGVWYTYDQVEKFGTEERNPLLELDRRKFKFDAIEGFGRMDNDWWATVLIKASDNTLQDSAPDGVGYNRFTTSNDGKINVGKDCFGCHDRKDGNGGLQPIDPYFRQLFSAPGPVGLPLKLKRDVALAREYLTPLDPLAEADRQAYARAVFQATMVKPSTWAAFVNEVYHDWDKPLSMEDVAWEHGVKPEEFKAGLEAAAAKHGGIDNVNSQWLKPEFQQKKITRIAAIEAYPKAELYLRGLTTWPVGKK